MLKRLLACLTALLLPATLLAEPVPISERGPVDIRRTTFVMRDIEKSRNRCRSTGTRSVSKSFMTN